MVKGHVVSHALCNVSECHANLKVGNSAGSIRLSLVTNLKRVHAYLANYTRGNTRGSFKIYVIIGICGKVACNASTVGSFNYLEADWSISSRSCNYSL
jgi:hypothetical protein